RLRVSDAFEARRNRVGLATGTLDPARQLIVQQQSTGADLLVLAHSRRGLLSELLSPGKVHRLLAGRDRVDCDVLLVPGAADTAAVRQSALGGGWTQPAS